MIDPLRVMPVHPFFPPAELESVCRVLADTTGEGWRGRRLEARLPKLGIRYQCSEGAAARQMRLMRWLVAMIRVSELVNSIDHESR